MVETVPQPAKSCIVQHSAMRSVLYDVMTNGHQHERNRGKTNRDAWTAGEGQPRFFAQPHGGQQDERLIEQNPRKSTGIGQPLLPANLEVSQHAGPVA